MVNKVDSKLLRSGAELKTELTAEKFRERGNEIPFASQLHRN